MCISGAVYTIELQLQLQNDEGGFYLDVDWWYLLPAALSEDTPYRPSRYQPFGVG